MTHVPLRTTVEQLWPYLRMTAHSCISSPTVPACFASLPYHGASGTTIDTRGAFRPPWLPPCRQRNMQRLKWARGAKAAHGSASHRGNPNSDHPDMQGLWELITGPEASSWSCLLVRDHLSSAGRLALFATSRAGQLTIITMAEHRSVTLDTRQLNSVRLRVANDVLKACLASNLLHPKLQLGGSAAALASCNQQKPSTKLQLTASTSVQVSHTLGALQPGVAAVDHVVLRTEGSEGLPRSILATLGCYCPHLHHLDIHGPFHELPNTQVLPNLRALTIGLERTPYEDQEQIIRSAAPYVKPLTFLAFPSREMDDHLPQLMTGGMGGHLLTLRLGHALTDEVLEQLVACAPALEELQVYDVSLWSADNAFAQPQWRRLVISGRVSISQLLRLPLTPAMEVVFDDAHLVCDFKHPFIPHLVCDIDARLDNVRFSARGGRFSVRHDTYADLRPGLNFLRRVHCVQPADGGSPVLRLFGSLTPQLMRELAGLPDVGWVKLDLSGLEFEKNSNSPDSYYAELLGLLPDNFHTVRFNYVCCGPPPQGDLRRRQVEGICLGAPTHRRICVELALEGWCTRGAPGREECESKVPREIQERVLADPRCAGGNLVVVVEPKELSRCWGMNETDDE